MDQITVNREKRRKKQRLQHVPMNKRDPNEYESYAWLGSRNILAWWIYVDLLFFSSFYFLSLIIHRFIAFHCITFQFLLWTLHACQMFVCLFSFLLLSLITWFVPNYYYLFCRKISHDALRSLNLMNVALKYKWNIVRNRTHIIFHFVENIIHLFD